MFSNCCVLRHHGFDVLLYCFFGSVIFFQVGDLWIPLGYLYRVSI